MVEPNGSGFLQKLRIYFREYCSRTTVHGFQYLGENKRTFFEKLWWFIAMVVCMGLSVYIVLIMYNQYKVSPIIVTFATKTTPIHNIPFPAVTICPNSLSVVSKLNFSNLEDVLSLGDNYTDEDAKLYDYASQVCDSELNFTLSNVNIVENVTDFYETLHNVRPDFLYNSQCIWLGATKNCSSIFTEILTDKGICYTFNLLDKKEMFKDEAVIYSTFQNVNKTSSNWMDGDGFKNDRTTDSYPYSATLPGVKNSLQIRMYTYNDEIDYKCTGLIQGFKVAFHVPERYPVFQEDHILVPLEQFVSASVQPNMVTTSDVVQKYDAHVRMCYFPHEKSLKYFKIYTQKNCLLECWASYTLKACGCVTFFMPHSNNTPICGDFLRHGCVQDATAQMQKVAAQDAENTSEICDCLPLCTDLSYDVSTSQAHMGWSKFYQAYGISKNETSQYHMAMLRVYFKSGHFITSQRNELYGPIGFLANFGGIIALFTGASILSVVEIIYFLTCRLFCNVRLFGGSRWSGNDDVV